MNNINLKSLLSVAFASALLVGCASTETDDSGQVATQDSLSGFDGSVSGGAASQQPQDVTPVEEVVELETVFYFDFDQSSLTPETRGALDAQIARLKGTVGTIRLEGHADERGTREYNIALGERRAKAVADYMALNGISRYRIETVSYGEERPAVFGQDDDALAKNRRVELK